MTKGKEIIMRKLICLIVCIGFLALGSNAIADDNYLIAKKDKTHKVKKEKKQKGPNQRAIERANPNAKFKRYQDLNAEEKKDLKKKKWGEMSEEEKETVSDLYKRHKDKLDEIMKGKKKMGDVK